MKKIYKYNLIEKILIIITMPLILFLSIYLGDMTAAINIVLKPYNSKNRKK